MASWEEIFRDWARPPSEAEQKRCETTEVNVREAIDASAKLKARDVRVFVQGSYRNNTNIPRESDVDIGVVCRQTFFADYPDGLTHKDFGNFDSDYTYAQFKNEVGEALVLHFGQQSVRRGNKAYDVRGGPRQVEADVVPFFEHRRYSKDGKFPKGVELRPDNGDPARIINWPEQHYENGVGKNNATGRRYKGLVRVLKNLRSDMEDNNIAAAKPAIGFLNECLVWNAPNNLFGNERYWDDLRGILQHLIMHTAEDVKCAEWGEVSELKYLFRASQKWTRQQAHDFLDAAWKYVGMR